MTSSIISSIAFAQASGAAPQGPGFMDMIPMFVVMFAIMYFLIIRPQQRKQKEAQDLLASLKPGMEVVTSGGLIGKIKSVSDAFVSLELSASAGVVKVVKGHIATTTESLRQPDKDAKKAAAKS